MNEVNDNTVVNTTTPTNGGDCLSCGEGMPRDECPHSKLTCGHHCNHSWTHNTCCWCGKDFNSTTADDTFYEALGWMHAECCAALDRGEDPRNFEIPEMVRRCERDLGIAPKSEKFADSGQGEPDGFDFQEALRRCDAGLEAWRSKPNNKKWWRKIDGTPIPNDLLVNIAMQFTTAPKSEAPKTEDSR